MLVATKRSFFFSNTIKQKPLKVLTIKGFINLKRGPERIRTAVAAFAELSLATRPQDHLISSAKVTIIYLSVSLAENCTSNIFKQGGHKQLS